MALAVALAAGAAKADSIRAVYCEGLMPTCFADTPFVLERDGDPVPFYGSWTLAYAGDSFVMTALKDVDDGFYPAFISLHPGTGPIIVPVDPPCEECGTPTQIAAIGQHLWPTVAGERYVLALTAVPEPASGLLLALGLAGLAGLARRNGVSGRRAPRRLKSAIASPQEAV